MLLRKISQFSPLNACWFRTHGHLKVKKKTQTPFICWWGCRWWQQIRGIPKWTPPKCAWCGHSLDDLFRPDPAVLYCFQTVLLSYVSSSPRQWSDTRIQLFPLVFVILFSSLFNSVPVFKASFSSSVVLSAQFLVLVRLLDRCLPLLGFSL